MAFIAKFVAQTIMAVTVILTIVVASIHLNNVEIKEFIVKIQSNEINPHKTQTFKVPNFYNEKPENINKIPLTSNLKNYFCQWPEQKTTNKKIDNNCQLFIAAKVNTSIIDNKIKDSGIKNITLKNWTEELKNIDNNIKNQHQIFKLKITNYINTDNNQFQNINIYDSSNNSKFFTLIPLFLINSDENKEIENFLQNFFTSKKLSNKSSKSKNSNNNQNIQSNNHTQNS